MTEMTRKPVGPWCGDPKLHPEHAFCTGVFPDPPPEGDFDCCANSQDGYGHHLGNSVPEDVADTGTLFPALPLNAITAAHAFPLYATQAQQDDLVEELAKLLDEAMHLEACWISEDETRCVCILGLLRPLLTRCGHIEQVGTKGLTRQCLSTVHPSAPYKHTFGTV